MGDTLETSEVRHGRWEAGGGGEGGELNSGCVVLVGSDVAGMGVKRGRRGSRAEWPTMKVLTHPGGGAGYGGGTGLGVQWWWVMDIQTRAVG